MVQDPEYLVLISFALSLDFLFLFSQRRSGMIFFYSPEFGIKDESEWPYIFDIIVYVIYIYKPSPSQNYRYLFHDSISFYKSNSHNINKYI